MVRLSAMDTVNARLDAMLNIEARAQARVAWCGERPLFEARSATGQAVVRAPGQARRAAVEDGRG